MGIIAHRAFQKLNLTTSGCEFFDEQGLMHILSSQPVGRSHQDQREFAKGCMIAQAV
jgi:hypothetical protein